MRRVFREAKEGEGAGFLAEDEDLALGLRFGVDPFVVNHVWPRSLRHRARTFVIAEAEDAHRRARKRQREDVLGDAATRRG